MCVNKIIHLFTILFVQIFPKKTNTTKQNNLIRPVECLDHDRLTYHSNNLDYPMFVKAM